MKKHQYNLDELQSIVADIKKKYVIRELDQINQSECLLIYQSIMHNAKNHLVIAELLASNEQYGSAITHSILGAEEMTKCLVIFLNGTKINLQAVKGYKGIIQSHLPRHTLANMIAMMAFIAEPMVVLLNHLKSDSSNTEKYIKDVLDSFDPQLKKIEEAMDFWFAADKLKNKGLYVDFRNQIMKPQDLTKVEFESIIKACLKHINLCDTIIEIVKTASPEILAEYQKQSNTEEFRKLISPFFQK